jgi:gliding motility-associated-like protein
VNPLPQASITASTEILCENENVTITSNEAVSYLWNTGATSQSISVNNAGLYHVTITDAKGCHATSGPIELKYIQPLPAVTLLSDCNKIFINQDLLVNWFQNDENIKLNSTLKEFYPSDSGNYHVEIGNQCGTKKSNSIHFIPADPHFITLPNVITPNGDAFNEFFLLDEKLSSSALHVINRWGKEVYYSEEYENNWNGDDLSSGTYYYIISNSCFAEKLKGIISIVR